MACEQNLLPVQPHQAPQWTHIYPDPCLSETEHTVGMFQECLLPQTEDCTGMTPSEPIKKEQNVSQWLHPHKKVIINFQYTFFW